MVERENLNRQESNGPSYDECLVEAELRARTAYAEPGRHYHGQRHLLDCIALVQEVQDLDEQEERLLRWAVLWHDAVYDAGASDNEERSAELAKRELVECGVENEAADEVGRLILLTRGHHAEEGDRLGALMVSIDLAILGSDPERYRGYGEAVRREYKHLSDAAWSTGRAAVLHVLLDREPLYPDAAFRDRFEAQARLNMKEEIRRLREG